MKKAIIAVVIVAVLVGGYSILSNLRLTAPGAAGKLQTITRGDLIIPIGATGEVRPAARHEVKSEASGEVVEIGKQAGDAVRAGELLIRLAKDDEERSVARAEAELKRADAALEKTKTAVKQRDVSIIEVQARRDRIKVQLAQAKFELDKIENLDADQTNPDERFRFKSNHNALEADLRGAEAAVEQAELNAVQSVQDVRTAEATHTVAKANLADAKERLSETEIRAKIDGLVTRMNVEVGDVIQGGKTVVGSGTLLATIADVSELLVRTEVQEPDIGEVLALAPAHARPKMAEAAALGGDFRATLSSQIDDDEGVEVKMEFDAFGDEVFTGFIVRIYPEPRKISNVVTYLVDIRLTGDNWHKVMLGMQAEVDFIVQSLTDVLLCPQDAIHRDESGRYGVYIPVKKEGQELPEAEFVEVEYGQGNGEFVPITQGEGIEEGDEVYTKLPVKIGRSDEDDD